jgi:hypothetical protein
MTLSDMVATIDTDRRHGNLSSAIRLFVLDYYRGRGTPPGRVSADLSPPETPPPQGTPPGSIGGSALQSE